ncbi:Os10g0417100 [Oryza sativa Japonica Group]|uniref:Os10g0417100 protein n=1 Tax=Oryza sativa subsp. japonica TaxID=39947 RepID=A0A0P0XU90_ORYSJ|nr:Os10g0417100 [Oryza sativa Japonica Group]
MTDNAVDELFVIWVKVFGLPGFAKKQEIIRAISDIVGEFKEVDEKSLKGEGAVRIKVGCLDPSAINYSVIIYINDIGYKIKWEAEVDTEGTGSIDWGGTMMMMMLMIWMMITLQEERKVGVRMPKGVQRKRNLLRMQIAKEGLSVENEVGVTAKGEDPIESITVEKKADKAVVLWKSEEFSQPELFEQVSQEEDKSGDLLKRMDVDLKLGGVRLFTDEEGEKCAIPADSDIELMRAEEDDDSEQLDLESEAEIQLKEVNFQKVRHKKKQVSLVKRQSSRVKDKEVSVHLKAELRKSKMNMTSGMSSKNSYAIFHSVSQDYLINIARARGISLGDNSVEVRCNLDAICARELAQATIFDADKSLQQMAEKASLEEEGGQEVPPNGNSVILGFSVVEMENDQFVEGLKEENRDELDDADKESSDNLGDFDLHD